MPKQSINPPELFQSLQYGFSQIVVSQTGQGERTVYLSGQVAWDERQQIVGQGDFQAQTHQALRNVQKAIQVAGGTMADIVSMRIYFVHERHEEISCISQALKVFFPSDQAPATTWLGVQSLANELFLIEIEAIGVLA